MARLVYRLSENNCEKWEARIIENLSEGWERSKWKVVGSFSLPETFKFLENDPVKRSIQHRMFLDLLALSKWQARFGKNEVLKTFVDMILERIQRGDTNTNDMQVGHVNDLGNNTETQWKVYSDNNVTNQNEAGTAVDEVMVPTDRR